MLQNGQEQYYKKEDYDMKGYTKLESAVLAVDTQIEYAYTESMFLEAFRRFIVNDFRKMGIKFKHQFINTEVTFNMRNMKLPSSIIKKNKPILALQVSEIEDPYRMFNTGPFSRDSVIYGHNVNDYAERFLMHHERESGLNMGVSLSMKRMGFNIEPTVIFSSRPDKSNARRMWEYERAIGMVYQIDVIMSVIVSDKVKEVWKKVHKLADDITLIDLAKHMRKHSVHTLSVLRNDGTGLMEIVMHLKVPTMMKYGDISDNARNRGNLQPGWDIRRGIEASFPIPTGFVFHTLTDEMIEDSSMLEKMDTPDVMTIDNTVQVGKPSFTIGELTKVWDVSYQSEKDDASVDGVTVNLAEAFNENCISNESRFYEYWRHLVDTDSTKDIISCTILKNGEDVTLESSVDINTLKVIHHNVDNDDSFTLELYTDLEKYNEWVDAKGEGYVVDTGSETDIMYPNKG